MLKVRLTQDRLLLGKKGATKLSEYWQKFTRRLTQIFNNNILLYKSIKKYTYYGMKTILHNHNKFYSQKFCPHSTLITIN